MNEGLDFYFVTRSHALRFIDFLNNVTPIRHRHDKQLISHNEHEASYTYKFTFSVEIVPVCKDDLVLLPKKLAASLGNIGPLVLCTRVSNIIQLIDPTTLRIANITAAQYWGGGNNTNINSNPIILMSSKQLVEFTVVESATDYSSHHGNNAAAAHGAHASGGGSRGRYRLCEAHCCRSDMLGRNDSMRFVRSHLGNIVNDGDLVLGYDVCNANFSGIDNRELERQMKVGLIPDVVLVKKHYSGRSLAMDDPSLYGRTGGPGAAGGRRKRRWKLRRMQVEIEESNRKKYSAADEERDEEQFYQDLEDDPEMRAMVNMFRDTTIDANAPAAASTQGGGIAAIDGGECECEEGDDERAPEVPIEELLDELTFDEAPMDDAPQADDGGGD